MLVRPTITAPARFRRATATASALAAGASASTRGTGARHLAFDVEQVFDRHRNARERREHGAGGAQAVVRIGGGAGAVGIDVHEDDRTLAGRVVDPFERGSTSARLVVRSGGEVGGKLGERGKLRRRDRHGVGEKGRGVQRTGGMKMRATDRSPRVAVILCQRSN